MKVIDLINLLETANPNAEVRCLDQSGLYYTKDVEVYITDKYVEIEGFGNEED